MIETYWGNPLTLVISENGDTKKFTTIEQAYYWLNKKWPVTDKARDRAIELIDAAMNCLAPVSAARMAFVSAARTAGFMPESDLGEVSPGV